MENIKEIQCPKCNGTGNIIVWVFPTQLLICPQCLGIGKIKSEE